MPQVHTYIPKRNVRSHGNSPDRVEHGERQIEAPLFWIVFDGE